MIESKEALLSVRGLEKKFGGFTALKSFDLDIKPGERIGVIGPNGRQEYACEFSHRNDPGGCRKDHSGWTGH